jgi:diaminopimelate epimerase
MIFVSKYSASGNDFAIFHTFSATDRSKLAKRVCNRNEGIGADGMVVLLPHETYDFQWQFYNSDGSHASMCGNASRAVAHYAYTHGLCGDNPTFLTGAGVISAKVTHDFVVSDLTPPKVIKDNIVEDEKTWSLIDTGVPHLVTRLKDISNFDLLKARRLREKYDANVNIWMKQDGVIFVRTYERGVEDETLACGTGTAACFLQGVLSKQLNTQIKAYPKSKEELSLSYENGIIKFGGKVAEIFATQFKD